MKRLLAGLCFVLLPLAAEAASPEATYLAARDKYVAVFTKYDDAGDISDAVLKKHDIALADLENLLSLAVGPVDLKSFGPPSNNLSTLFPSDEGYGALDAISYGTDGDTTAFVTTEGLLKAWLASWHTDRNLPTAIDAALKDDEFYTYAISPDAAVERYAGVPFTPGENTTVATAMLASIEQDIGPMTPDQLIIAVEKGSRIFIVEATATATITPIPACEKIAADYKTKEDAAYAAYQTSGPTDEKLFDKFTALQEDADRDYRACFDANAPTQPFFAALKTQVQSLVDTLPAE